MKFITTFALAVISTVYGKTLALPLEARDSCQYNYLPQLWSISQHQPTSSNGPQTSVVDVNQDIGRKDLIVSFQNIPQGSWGCNLQFDYKPGHGAYVWGIGDPQVINVYAINGNLPTQPTWDNITPLTGSLVGTFQFPTGTALNEPKLVWINSLVCQSTLNYRLAVANTDRVKGGVYDTDDAGSGLRISHNC
ncbi:hypothetical protein EJ06DRAFT_162109 [Trichodelitschia bisporula]|uniref:Ubiquitin 3 binding protein But2 C-terminal domain-containing protein n=1 Tax=Trichodelitschia bisporula TaxID=703511 RepID=A0A6G1HMR2_9PEZI|nr:hypothetical protein EJ06DRAFT_162109 [Trichodelitschia bisporula]